MFDECVILAGGSGTRLWPLSSEHKPKQFLRAPGSGLTFFGMALRRAFSCLRSAGRLTVVSTKPSAGYILGECAALPPGERARACLLVEPSARNTAAAIACAVRLIKTRARRDCSILALTSDHVIAPEEAFAECAARAARAAAGGRLVVFGVRPASPETGYGYIRAAREADGADGAYAVSGFREKPDAETARRYVEAGDYYWNSGMFAFTLDFIGGEFLAHCPDLALPLEALAAPGRGDYSFENNAAALYRWPGLDEAYARMPSVSFDCAIAEKCARAAMIPASFSWTDIGSWDEYARCARASGEAASVDARDNFVCSDIPVALCGVDNLVVVIRGGEDGRPPVALVARKGHTQKVRAVVEQLKARGEDCL